jgi:hypothetical protein
VTIGNDAPTDGFLPSKTVPDDTVVSLSAQPKATFSFGFWIGTDGDKSASHDQNASTQVTVGTKNITVHVCCPFGSGTTCP